MQSDTEIEEICSFLKNRGLTVEQLEKIAENKVTS